MLESKAVIRKSLILTCCRACSRMQYAMQEKLSMNLTSHTPLGSPTSSRRVLTSCMAWVEMHRGNDFGSFVTYQLGCFVYFSIGSLTIFLFMGTAAPETEKERLEH